MQSEVILVIYEVQNIHINVNIQSVDFGRFLHPRGMGKFT